MEDEGVVGLTLTLIPRLSLYLSVTGGNDWSVYYVVMTRIGSFYPAVFLSYTFFFIFASWLQALKQISRCSQSLHEVAHVMALL